MSASNLIELTCFDANAGVHLTACADTIITEYCKNGKTTRVICFGGYPEVVQALLSAIYGGSSIEAIQYGEHTDGQCELLGKEIVRNLIAQRVQI